MEKKAKIRGICDLVLGILILTVTVIAYFGHWGELGEYCCVSSITVGTVYLSSFIYHLKSGRFFSDWVYADCSVATLMILIATLALGLNLNDAFIFIHIIDPLLMLAYWAFFCDHSVIKRKLPVLTVLVFPACYLVLSLITLSASGDCAFPASLVLTGHSPVISAGLVIAVLSLFLVLGICYHFLNRLIKEKLHSKKNMIPEYADAAK